MSQETYISVGLTDPSIGMVFPSEAVDEVISARKAERCLKEVFGPANWASPVFHVDWGSGEPFVHIAGTELSPKEEDYFLSIYVPIIKQILEENKDVWLVSREAYVGRLADWQYASQLLHRRNLLDEAEALDGYLAYHLKKLDDNAILVTDETIVVVYLGPSDGDGLFEAIRHWDIRHAGQPDTHQANKVTELIYPLTAAETGFEDSPSCDIEESLQYLSLELEKRCAVVFPNARCFFPIFPKEKNKTGSLSLYSGSRVLYNAFELERMFFDLAGEAVTDTDSWYVN